MADAVGIAKKTPTEKIPTSVDFVDVLPLNETIQSTYDVKITDSAGTDTTSDMLVQKSQTGSKINAIIHAGTDQKVYTVKFIAITQSYRFESFVTLLVAV